MKKITFIALCCMLTACKTNEKIVNVPEYHTEHHWHTDSFILTDSVIREKETRIIQADSALMAKYGIRLYNNEKAWLVLSQSLERKIKELTKQIQDKDTIHDSIPFPVEVPVEVPAKLSRWQKIQMDAGKVTFIAIAAIAATALVSLILRKS